MRFVLHWDGVDYDPASLTLPELDKVELIAMRPFGEINPLLRVGDFTALLVVFLERTLDADDIGTIVQLANLGDIGTSIVLTGT